METGKRLCQGARTSSASIDDRVFLGKELAGNDPVLMAAYEGTPDVEKHPVPVRVGMQKDLLLHMGIGRCRFMALGAAKDMRDVFQPDVNTRTVFVVFDPRNFPVFWKHQPFLVWFSCGHSAALSPCIRLFCMVLVRNAVTITPQTGFVKVPPGKDFRDRIVEPVCSSGGADGFAILGNRVYIIRIRFAREHGGAIPDEAEME